MLSKNESLKTLTLDHNNIGSEGLAQLARGLVSNSSLTVTLFHWFFYIFNRN